MPDRPPEIVLSRPTLDAAGLAALGVRWRRLEPSVEASPFQTWTWVGTIAAQYADPLLIEAKDSTGLVAIALLNRRRTMFGDVLYLHETGDPARDAVFIEWNGPLTAPSQDALCTRMLRAALDHGRATRLVLSGVDPATLAAAERTGAATTQHQSRVAPFIDLGAIPPGEAYIDQLSRNARAQLRRSDRAYAATGPLRIERARTVAEGLQFLDALIVLHTATWRARGRPGAFATPVVRAFHQALVRRGIPGDVALFRITAGSTPIGYLYNLEHEGRACTYQSGFDYPGGGGTPMKPGLTCHHLAIEAHRAGGGTEYDFLGGADRYKLSLATSTRPLHWLTLTPHWHPAALMDRFRR